MRVSATVELPGSEDPRHGAGPGRGPGASGIRGLVPAAEDASPTAFGCAAVELSEAAAARRVDEAVAALRAGRSVLVVDGAGGGTVVATADAADARTVTFMAVHARGLVQLALTPERCDRLGLFAMVRTGGDRPATGMTRSIEARRGVGTGISAADRARTIAAAIADDAAADDLVGPGHMFPVRTHVAGVRGAAGPAEAAVDLARLAGARPAGVLCVVLDDEGAVATGDALRSFAVRHGLRSVAIGDVVARRAAATPQLEVRRDEVIGAGGGAGSRMVRFRSLDDGATHVAFVRGDVGDGAAVPTWIGARDVVAGVPVGGPGGSDAARALTALGRAGRGVVVLASRPCAAPHGVVAAGGVPGDVSAGRSGRPVDVGAAVLRTLGVRRVRSLLPGDAELAALGRRGLVVEGPVVDAA